MITDGVHEPTGSKRHRGSGHPWHLPSLPATPSKRCRGADSPIPYADDALHDSPRGQQSYPLRRRCPPSVVVGPTVRRPQASRRYRLHRHPTWPGLGSAAPVREHDTRGNGGGFAALGASCRRVAGVSRLYWCNSPRLVAPSTWGEPDRAPLMAQFPRLLAVRSRFGAVRSRFGAVRCPHRRPPRRQTPTMGCRGRGVLRCGHNGAWPRVSLAREPAIASASLLFRT